MVTGELVTIRTVFFRSKSRTPICLVDDVSLHLHWPRTGNALIESRLHANYFHEAYVTLKIGHGT